MFVNISAFAAPKAGNADSEYEDAYSWKSGDSPLFRNSVGHFSASLSGALIRCAVADGATETSFSAAWANLLVRAYCCERISKPERRSRGLAQCRKVWRRLVHSKQLPWYAEEKLRSGAYSSLIGLSLLGPRPGGGRRWRCESLGDSCLFQFRGDELKLAFPIDRVEMFSSRPFLIPSIHFESDDSTQFEQSDGCWEVGDEFYLLTDAVAAWLLRSWHLRADPLGHLRAIETKDLFQKFIESQRTDMTDDGQPMMRNDDVTIVRCKIAEG